jgi:hypothetical protein
LELTVSGRLRSSETAGQVCTIQLRSSAAYITVSASQEANFRQRFGMFVTCVSVLNEGDSAKGLADEAKTSAGSVIRAGGLISPRFLG